jgi:CHAD domain-containing protein
VLDDSGLGGEAVGELPRIVERAHVVRDRPAVGAPLRMPTRYGAKSLERRCEPELGELERNRRRNALDELARVDDHHEALGGGGYRFLARVRAATPFHEPAVRVDLVGAVDREVNASRRARACERLQPEPELARRGLRRRRGRDAAHVETTRRERLQQVRDRGAGTEADHHPALDELRGSPGREPLLGVEPHRGGRYPETTVENSPERELKLPAEPDFRMPSIYGLGGATVRNAPPERNDTTYYDTDDLRLARWGASLRHRPGEGWTVKLPAERDKPFLVRPEIVFEGNGDAPPAAAADLVRGFVRGVELHPRLHMTTIRRRTGIHDSGGHLIGGVVDDAVSVSNGDASETRFRELEVEIGDETTPALLDALVERLRQAGAGAPDQTAKYIRALAPTSPLLPEVEVPDLGADASAGNVARRAIALSVIRLIRHDPVVRLDADPEGVHQARVATRRLRSDLRTFRPLIDAAWSSALRDELGWLADLLGDVRDGDVLLERLRHRVAELPDAHERDAAAAVLATLEHQRDAAHSTLLDALRSRRYFRLLDSLVAAANDPSLRENANEPASDIVPELVRRPWHKLEKRVGKLGDSPSDEELHEVRIRTKRVRYAAEAAEPIAGKPARAFAKAAERLQDVLGELNDAVVAEQWLAKWARPGRPLEELRGAEALAERERVAARLHREGWASAWKELSSPRLRDWM